MSSENAQDEQKIWQRFLLGDENAYAFIYNLYFKKLYNYGLRIVANEALVEDCIQNLFIRLWHNKTNLSLPQSVRAYLFESLRRGIIRELAKQKKISHTTLSDSYSEEVEFSPELHLINDHLSAERLLFLEAALKKLSKRQREVIYLKFYSQLTYEEIASVMGLTVNSVYNLVSKAIDALQNEF